jgi:hypothetical protein
MKKILFVFLLPLVAHAEAPDRVAYERFGYELSMARDAGDKMDSAGAYFDALNRIGAKPAAPADCLRSLDGPASTGACRPIWALFMRAGGTGGVE